MGNVNLANRATTICGALVALLTVLASTPGLEAYAGLLRAAAGVAGALGLYFAKDATTGSTPDGKL